jgi:hypothetical protein
MPQFTPGQNVEFIGEIAHGREGQTETDYDLYRDVDTQSFFIVASVSIRSGKALSNSHTRLTVEGFLAAHPSHRGRTVDMLRARAARGGVVTRAEMNGAGPSRTAPPPPRWRCRP